MSHHPSGSRRSTDRQRPSRSSRPSKCGFHLSFGLGEASWGYELADGVTFSYAEVRWIEKPPNYDPVDWDEANKYRDYRP